MRVSFSVRHDFAPARAAIARLPRESEAAMRRATVEGTAILEANAQRTINRRTGRTAGTIRASVDSPPGLVARGTVGSSDPVATYLEFGTRPHEIRARPGGVLRFTVGNRVVFARSVRHPGTRPYLWLSRAVQEAKGPVERAFDREVGEVFD